MTEHKPNPFNILNPDRSGEGLKASTKRSYESARVNFVLGRVGLSGHKREFMKRVRSETGGSLYSFRLFREEFPTFPMWLTCDNLTDMPAPLHKMKNAVLPLWFKNFPQLPFMPFYEKLYEELGEQMTQLKPVGMIFPRRGFEQGFVVHNGDMQDFVSVGSSCHVYLGGRKKDPRMLVVQPTMSLLDHIYNKGHGWKP